MSERVFITSSELSASTHGSKTYQTYELKLMLLEDTEKAREECPLPNFNDLPQAIKETLTEWVGGSK